ncbi:MAG: CoA pyrophosphatase [Chloroflexota bacterium]
MVERLKEALAKRPKQRIVDASLMASAVLIPVYLKDGEYYLLFTKRTEKVRDHKGQISFPGGAHEVEDSTLFQTALRECTEEIGLAPEAVELLGELDDSPTHTSNYIISPFVGLIPYPYPFKADPFEIDELIEVPISVLCDKSCYYEEHDIDGRGIRGESYHCNGKIIWGATARILNQFLEIWTQAMKGGKD